MTIDFYITNTHTYFWSNFL